MSDESFFNTIAAYDVSAEHFDEKIASLPNYLPTYEELNRLLPSSPSILDLACGPANISRFICKKRAQRAEQTGTPETVHVTGIDLSQNMLALAKKHIPDGVFLRQSVVDFVLPGEDAASAAQLPLFDAVLFGFGLPYLSEEQAQKAVAHAVPYIKHGGFFYVSFMQGSVVRTEHPSFNPAVQLEVHYHQKSAVSLMLTGCGFNLVRSWALDYAESDGSITTDIVLLAQKP